jgi:hypothetical protein
VELVKEQQREILRLRAENDETVNAVQDTLAEVLEISLELEGQFDTNTRLSLANVWLRKERDLMAECLDAKQESQGKARRPSCACCLDLFGKNLQLRERLKMEQAEKNVIASELVRYRSDRDSLLQDIIDTKRENKTLKNKVLRKSLKEQQVIQRIGKSVDSEQTDPCHKLE